MVAPDCVSCGTCCFSNSVRYARVTGEDFGRLGDRAEALVEFIGNRAYMRMVDGHCAALRLERLEGRFLCTVYQSRPQVCRDLQRSSPECLGELAAKGDRPLVALRRARSVP